MQRCQLDKASTVRARWLQNVRVDTFINGRTSDSTPPPLLARSRVLVRWGVVPRIDISAVLQRGRRGFRVGRGFSGRSRTWDYRGLFAAACSARNLVPLPQRPTQASWLDRNGGCAGRHSSFCMRLPVNSVLRSSHAGADAGCSGDSRETSRLVRKCVRASVDGRGYLPMDRQIRDTEHYRATR